MARRNAVIMVQIRPEPILTILVTSTKRPKVPPIAVPDTRTQKIGNHPLNRIFRSKRAVG
jgi:hypothetical protein